MYYTHNRLTTMVNPQIILIKHGRDIVLVLMESFLGDLC